jgi:hypothetical protein
MEGILIDAYASVNEEVVCGLFRRRSDDKEATISSVDLGGGIVINTTTTHNFVDGDWGWVTGVTGLDEANNGVFRIGVNSSTQIFFYDTSGSYYTAWSSGGTVRRVTIVREKYTGMFPGTYSPFVHSAIDTSLVNGATYNYLGGIRHWQASQPDTNVRYTNMTSIIVLELKR